MIKRAIVAADPSVLTRFCKKTGSEFEFTCAETAADALAALDGPALYSVLVAAMTLPDMACGEFLDRAAKISRSSRILLVEEDETATAMELANRHGIFRLLPAGCDDDMLTTALTDAARQFCLVVRERQMREKIKKLSPTDSLTGCYTPEYLRERLTTELHRSVRYSHYLSVIFCDIDRLKAINDSHGYRVGDQVLTGFSQAAMQVVREGVDWITRWDEDAFIIVLPETPIRGAGIVAERLRGLLAEIDVRDHDKPVRVTASFGVSGFAPEIPERNNRVRDLLTIAGRCLAQAKAGGNRVLCCP